jgi:hypothetical protein
MYVLGFQDTAEYVLCISNKRCGTFHDLGMAGYDLRET